MHIPNDSSFDSPSKAPGKDPVSASAHPEGSFESVQSDGSEIISRLDDVIRLSVDRLRKAGNEEARREVEWMLESIMGIRRMQLLMHQDETVSQEAQLRLQECIERRVAREPLQYILGEAHFYGRRFSVRPGVLIPRPETELLAEWAIQALSGRKGERLLDLGTGSGCLPITVALERPGTECTGVDLSRDALEIARANARDLDAKVHFVEGDMVSTDLALQLHSTSQPHLASQQERPFDVLISNPPYIPESEREELQPEVLDHEPQMALFAGTDPLHFYRGIASSAPALLKSGGWLCVEIHSLYGNEVQELFKVAGFRDVALQQDLAGRDRLVSARMI